MTLVCYTFAMSLLHLDVPERPDYRPMSSVVIVSIQLGLPPLLIFALVVHSASPAIETEPAMPTHTDIAEVVFHLGEDPHTHTDTEDPTPRSFEIEMEQSTRVRSVPFIPMDDSANISIMLRHAARRRAGYAAANAMSSTSSPALWLAVEMEKNSNGNS